MQLISLLRTRNLINRNFEPEPSWNPQNWESFKDQEEKKLEDKPNKPKPKDPKGYFDRKEIEKV